MTEMMKRPPELQPVTVPQFVVNEYNQLKLENIALKDQLRWRPVSEKPKESDRYIVKYRQGKIVKKFIADYDVVLGWNMPLPGVEILEYLPIPPAPEGVSMRKLNEQWVEEIERNRHMLKAPPSDSSHKSIDGVVCTQEVAVQPVFSIGDKIRFKSTGEVEKVRTITHGGRFINSVSVKDIEKIGEDDYCNSNPFTEEVRIV